MPSEDILSAAPVAPDQRVHYGSAPEQYADLYFAAERSRAPLLINIHGGFWRAAHDLAHASHFCAAMAASGVNTANLEYRRVGHAGGGWPGTLDDIRAGCRFLTDNAKQLAFATPPSVVVGHSAGGQLALWIAAAEKSVRACVSLGGVLNLRRAWELHLGRDAVVEYLGGTPEEFPERYHAASPIELPVTGATQVIVHGLEDDVVPPAISRDYVETKRQRAEQVEFVPILAAGHFELIDPRTTAFSPVTDILRRLTRDMV